MLKIVVYGRGRGGEVVAEYLEEELGVIEVIRVIDWAPAEAVGEEWLARAERNLARFWGRVAAIVLADTRDIYLRRLQTSHPEQKIVALGVNKAQIQRNCSFGKTVAILSTYGLDGCSWHHDLQQRLPRVVWMLPDGVSWGSLIDQDLMSFEVLCQDLKQDFGECLELDRGEECGTEAQLPIVMPEKRIRARLSLAQAITLEKHRIELVSTVMRLEQFGLKQARERRRQLAQRGRRARMLIWGGKEEITTVAVSLPDVVLLIDPRLWLWKEEIAQIFGWQVQIMDFRKKLLRDTCVSLGLLGIDGERNRDTQQN